MARNHIHAEAQHLYEDIQVVYGQFKKAMARVSNAHKAKSLTRVFGSSVSEYFQVVLTRASEQLEVLEWRCPLPMEGAERLSFASIKEIKKDSTSTIFKFDEHGLYEEAMPLNVREKLHNRWKEQLAHVTALLGQSMTVQTPFFNWWTQDQLLLELGFCTIENEDSEMFHHLNDRRKSLLEVVLKAIEQEPQVARIKWPTLVPWLQMIQLGFPPPQDDDSHSWTQWHGQLQSIYRNAQANQEPALALPTDLTGEHAPF